MRLFYVICISVFLIFPMSACKPDAGGKKSDAASSKADVKTDKSDDLFGGVFSSEPESALLVLGDFKLLDVVLGTALDSDNFVIAPKSQFTVKDKIYASILSTGKHQGLTMKALWTAPDGRLVAETRQALVPAGATVSTFSISNDQPWPIGAYTLDISINDQVQRTVSFEVK